MVSDYEHAIIYKFFIIQQTYISPRSVLVMAQSDFTFSRTVLKSYIFQLRFGPDVNSILKYQNLYNFTIKAA